MTVNPKKVSVCKDCGMVMEDWDRFCESGEEMCYNGTAESWACGECGDVHADHDDAFLCCVNENTPQGVTAKAIVAIKKGLFRTPVVTGMSSSFIDDMDRLAERDPNVMEFTWRENPEGSDKYDLNLIGILNGFLAQKDRTLFLQQDIEDLAKIGFGIFDNTRFLEPTESQRYLPEPARYEDIEEEYRTPEGLTKIAEDMAQAILLDIPIISGVPSDKIDEMDATAKNNPSFDRMEFEWVESKTEEGKYDLHLLGVLNGFLLSGKQRIMPVMLHVGDDKEGRFASIMITEEED